MKILRVASELYPYVIGGVGLHVHDLSIDQTSGGYEVTIYTCLPSSDVIDDSDKYSIVNFGRKLVLAGNTISVNMFLSIINNCNKYDIVHAHSHLYFSTFLCAIIRRFKKYNLVITNHGLVSQTIPLWFQKMYNASLGRFIFSMADLIITYTKEEKEMIDRLRGNPNKTLVVHNGIKAERFQTPLNVPKKKQFLWIGRYVSGKGARFLLYGFTEFCKEYPDYSLMMIGKGPEKDLMDSLIYSLSIQDKVTMVDFIPNDRLQAVYESSEVFVSSSLAEGVPKTMLEAMVCGLPVISTDLPQLTDIVKDCGIIVPCSDSHAIAEAMKQMVSNPDIMKTYGENARQKVLSSYDWKDTVQKTNEAFEKLLN